MIKALLHEEDLGAAILMGEHSMLASLLQIHNCRGYEQLARRIRYPVYFDSANYTLSSNPPERAYTPLHLPHEDRYEWAPYQPAIVVAGVEYYVRDIVSLCSPVQVVQTDPG